MASDHEQDWASAAFSNAAGVADATRREMEVLGAEVRDLVIGQPPIQLLSYFISHFHMAMMGGAMERDPDQGPDAEVIKSFQLALEYLHAVWSCHAPLVDERTPLDEAKAGQLFETLEKLENATTIYCMASSVANRPDRDDHRLSDLEFHAKTSWALIRGNRYQVLEGEFFRFVLAPHDAALREAYGAGADDIAAGIQAIADAFRSGIATAVEGVAAYMDRVNTRADAAGEDIETAIKRLDAEDPTSIASARGLFQDILFGGVCNLTRHSKLPPHLLEDLSFVPGENKEFYGPGDYAGTPMRTLPARVKPGIRLGEDIYATDGQFVRDSAYRAIQRGLAARLPYRDTWIERQGQLMEEAFTAIFPRQLAGAETIRSVYYREVGTDRWAETDRVILVEDVLVVIEAKAGNLPMQSPATNFSSHERVIQALLVKAYEQCRRFIDYLASAPEVPLYELKDGQYVEIRRIRMDAFREILPIGLTVEAFTPFSAMAKELPDVVPIAGRYPFVAMSVDDLFVLTRFLPTTGALLHYLRTRQLVAGFRGAKLFDETDHLGAYIADNRFDISLGEQLGKADIVSWTGFSGPVDRHFEGPDWDARPVPAQKMPERVARILALLDVQRPANWLLVDDHLRDYGEAGKNDVDHYLAMLEPTLDEHPRRRFELGGKDLLQVWLCRSGAEPSDQELRRYAQASCVALGNPEALVLVLSYRRRSELVRVECGRFAAPNLLQSDLADIQRLAASQRGRIQKLPKISAKAGGRRRKRR